MIREYLSLIWFVLLSGDTLLCIFFFLINIDVRDVLAGADMLSDTESVVEMFSIPAQRQYPLQQLPLPSQQP